MSSFNSEDDLASYIRTIQEKQFQARVEYGGSSGSWCAGVVDVTVHESDTAGDATTHAVVVGRVSDRDGSVLEGATVLARARTATAASDDKGFFRLSIPTQGLPEDFAVVIQARMIGFSTLSHRVVLSPGDSVNIDLSLCRSAISMDEMVVSERSTSEAITNNQHAGVDEGGIVKRHGDHLVILRRGRLFTVLVGDDALRPVAEVDAFGPGINPNGAWYDELLVSGDQVVVVGYSYARGGTEVGVFKIDEVGKIEHQATYQLKSNDYYSSRNYASRLVGSQLVFYSPLYLPYDLEDPLAALPAFRSWSPNAPAQPFRRTGNPRRVYGMAVEGQAAMDIALHTVTTCDLSTQPLNCESTVLVGPGGRVSYVSPQAVYVWMTHRTPTGDEPPRSTLARLPLDGSPPSALVVKGSPVDQFSFLESEDGYLNVLVRDVGYGDAMWASEFGSGDPALLRVSIANFGDGSEEALPGSYRALPQPETGVFTNRFVGEYLVYGVGSGRFRPRGDGATIYVAPLSGGPATSIPLKHGVDRVEAMGSHAVVIGTDGNDLHFTGIRLGSNPSVNQHYELADAAQGELRSHGFFYREDEPESGIVGLPVRGGRAPGYQHLFAESSAVIFLRNGSGQFTPLGKLESGETAVDDGCLSSCVDWYGNSRPLFVDGRVMALLGYELVEGVMGDDGLDERRRVRFGSPGKP